MTLSSQHDSQSSDFSWILGCYSTAICAVAISLTAIAFNHWLAIGMAICAAGYLAIGAVGQLLSGTESPIPETSNNPALVEVAVQS